MGSGYRGRLAPSPTGYLHPGHLSTFLIAARRCAEQKGTLVFRMEDLDRSRCRPEFDRASLEDLGLFLEWQEGPDLGGPHKPYRQSERLKRDIYLPFWQKLRDGGWIYPCNHTRRQIQAKQKEQGIRPGPTGELSFPRALRSDVSASLKYQRPENQAFRFRVPDEKIEFKDNHLGSVAYQGGTDFGDFLIWSVEGYPSYEFAVVVDDALMGITEVVRGEDLLLSTARQLLLYRALELEIPEFYHCPLLRDDSGERLAKRKGSSTIRSLLERGWSAERIARSCMAESPDPELIQAISK
ncbi:MAG TPA: tRNA glutamyl-Q synthetase [Leptospiraceae bacterium]|nr:tRNA glutamyl-Q synthetase [Spirochaetaceae bacterium]HBS04367.1 tRNA glutamyl-Q synthetase [Leptospiraceae bacterium]|tara:strand:+ start:28139 stop:29029 length:891 start_codon:yes stop_codon:yes gene_type:complete